MTKRTWSKKRPKHWVERDKYGKFKKWTSRSASAKADRRTNAKTKVKSGYGHKGDQKKR